MHEAQPMTHETESTLPEIDLQHEVREHFRYKPSANKWYWPVLHDGTPLSSEGKAELLLAQKEEIPYLMSAVLERTCNLSCSHCLYQSEKSSKTISEGVHLAETIQHMAHEMPEKTDEYAPRFMSCGRILRPWHLEMFNNIREDRPDIQLGVIDNGTYANQLDKWPDGFKFDWMDVSIDGTPEHHDAQRGNGAFKQAMEGLSHVREVVRSQEEGGNVSSLLTLTTLNARDIEDVAKILLTKNEQGKSLVDEFVVTTMSPTNETNKPLEIRDKETFEAAWEGLKKASEQFSSEEEGSQVSLKIYRVQDMQKLAEVLGERRFMEIFCSIENPPRTDRNSIEVEIDGVTVDYFPLSLWPPEEFLIDADGAYRTAYEGKFTLDELRSGKAQDGETTIDTTPYTATQLSTTTPFRETYEGMVDHWWEYFGHTRFDEEMTVFAQIREKAIEQGFVPPIP
jgi:sulfatase maturation enzyme AslB (radical SAM superfamily)